MKRLFWLLPGVILGLIIFIPLSWVAPIALPANLTQAETTYRGTLWRGDITALRDINSVRYSLNPAKFLLGGAPVRAKVASTGLQIDGDFGQYAAEDIDFRINVANLPMPDPRLQGLAGQINVNIQEVEWGQGNKCKVLSGTSRTDVLTRNQALFSWEGPALAGPLSCDDAGNFIFNLAGKDDLQSVSAKISISASGDYNTDISVLTRDTDAAQVLPLFGFDEREQTPQGIEFRLVEQGKWR